MASFNAFSVDGDDLHASDSQFDQDDVVVESYADYGPAAAPDSLDVFRFDGSGSNYSHSTPFDSVPVENGNGNGYGVGENDIDRRSELLQLLNDVVGTSKFGDGVTGMFRKDCIDLVRRIALLTHLFKKIRVFKGNEFGPLDTSTSSTNSGPTKSWVSNLAVAKRVNQDKPSPLLFVAYSSRKPIFSTHYHISLSLLAFNIQLQRIQRRLHRHPFKSVPDESLAEIVKEVQFDEVERGARSRMLKK
ncbi:hypothetical protein ACFX2J_030720 [Malus domestica]